MKVIFPAGWTPMKGADISSVPDNQGWFWIACFATHEVFPDQLIVWRQKGTDIVPIPLPSTYTARGQLNWCPGGLVLSAWDTANDDGSGAVSAEIIYVPGYSNWDTFNWNVLVQLSKNLSAAYSTATPLERAIIDVIRQMFPASVPR